MKYLKYIFSLILMLCTQQIFAALPKCSDLVSKCNVGRENGSCVYGGSAPNCIGGASWTSSQCQIQSDSGGSYVQICAFPYRGASTFICAAPYGSTYGTCDPSPPPPPPPPPSGGSGSGTTGSGTTSTSGGSSCNDLMLTCDAKVKEAEKSGSLRLMKCEQRSTPSDCPNCPKDSLGYSDGVTSMVCLADSSGTGADARCMACPNGGSASDYVYGNGTSLPDFTPVTDLSKRQKECTDKGGAWSSDGTTWTCTTTTGSTSYDAEGKVITPQQVELNCGGDTGISCESTQLKLLDSLGDINKNIKDFVTLPANEVDCSVGTQCYKDKEKSVLDTLTKKLGQVPENIVNLHSLVLTTFLEPFKNDKTAGKCNPASFLPITLSLKSIDGKEVTYVQPLPGDFLCKLFAIVRIFLVTGAIISGFRLIVTAFVISS